MQIIHTRARPTERYAEGMRRSPTPAEAAFWKLLGDGNLTGGWLRQEIVGTDKKYILDFYCPHIRLCVEIDGGYHKAQRSADQQRDSYVYVACGGIKTIRFTNEEVLKQGPFVFTLIAEYYLQHWPTGVKGVPFERPKKSKRPKRRSQAFYAQQSPGMKKRLEGAKKREQLRRVRPGV